ncbi:MAG: hypothetical protein KDK70_16055 [Myxococcales bacterium]|nr:hypothetical protein [Myxococcales bacterium]
MYEREVHYSLTHALAAAAGFDASIDAQTIAAQDQYVDEDPKTQPMPTGTWDVVSKANYNRLRDFHFVTSKRLDVLDQQWRSTGSMIALGTYLHAFQDSYSHVGLGPGTGQIGTYVDEQGVMRRGEVHSSRWHEVDDPSKRPGWALTMAKNTYGILVDAVTICSRKGTVRATYSPWSWKSISGMVGNFCVEPNANTRAHIADQLLQKIARSQTGVVGSAGMRRSA